MATAIDRRAHRTAILAGALVGLAILVVTRDPTGVAPYVLLALAACVALAGYLRER